MHNASLRAPLRRPVFRRIAASYAVNQLGDWIGVVALSVLVYDQTESALATTALFLATGFAPAVLAPLFVTSVEKPPPRVVLPVIYCGQAAVFAGLVYLAQRFSLPGVVALAVVDGVLATAGRALTRSVSAALLEPAGELRAGNAVLNIAFTGSAAVGPALGGLVAGAFGVQIALLLDAISFCVVGWVLFTAGTLPRAEPEPGRLRERIRAGFSYVRGRTALRRLLVAQSLAFIFFSAVLPIEVIYVHETLGGGDSAYGLLLASWGVGMVVGGVVFAAIHRAPLPLLLFFGTITIGLGYIGLAAAPTLAVAYAAAVIGGAGNGAQWVSLVSAIQEQTAAEMQARVMSVLEAIATAMPGIGFIAGGLIATFLDPRATFLFAGIGVLAIVALMAPRLGKEWPTRREQEGAAEPDRRNDVALELIPAAPGRSNSEVWL